MFVVFLIFSMLLSTNKVSYLFQHVLFYLLYTDAKSLKLKVQGGVNHSCYFNL